MPQRELEDWFWQIGGELQRLNDELARGRPKLASGRGWEPRVDLFEEEHRFMLRAEIAGVRGEDIQLLYNPDRHSLLIKGNRQEDEDSVENRVGIHQLEIFYGGFMREVPLPATPIDADRIRAQYRNGFLIVMIPKRERTTGTKQIVVKRV